MQDANISGADIANALGVSSSRVSQMLNGKRMHEDQIRTICDILGISADVLIHDSLGHVEDSYDLEFLRLYREMDPDARVTVIQLMRLITKKQK